jgi:DNA-binding beta-propeller fold protein YncE
MTLVGLAVVLVSGAEAAGPFVLVSGRWDNTVVVLDLAKALDPANDGTPNAVVNRLRVTPDIDAQGTGRADTPASGQPVNVVIPPQDRFAYVVNHSGSATEAAAAAFQHGHVGTVTALDLTKALDPGNQGTMNAMAAVIPTGGFGPVGLAVTPDGRFALVSNSEGDGDEEGGRTISVIDLGSRTVVQKVTQAYGKPGFPCPPTPLPHTGPHPTFGCFPDSNGVGISPLRGGYVFTANGGTDDVAVIDLQKALAGDPAAELARIPVAVGAWGLAVSPDGRLVATANRESARTGVEGNTISVIDVEKAIASNFRSNNVSVIDVRKALAGEPAEVARIPFVTPSGAPSRPRGIAITPDVRFATITGAPRGAPSSGVVWILDLASLKVVSRVTGVGNEAYLLAILPEPRS